MAHELRKAAVSFRRELRVPLNYDGELIDAGYRVDLLVDEQLIVEIKCVEHLLPIHSAQVMTYMKLLQLRHGLLLNFNVELMRTGLKSLFNSQGQERIHM